MEGYLTKLSVGGGILSNWRKRYFVLEGDELYWFESDKQRDKPKGSIPISGTVVGVIHEAKAHFCVNDRKATHSKQRLLELRAADAAEMRAWVQALSLASIEERPDRSSTSRPPARSSAASSVTAKDAPPLPPPPPQEEPLHYEGLLYKRKYTAEETANGAIKQFVLRFVIAHGTTMCVRLLRVARARSGGEQGRERETRCSVRHPS